MWVRSVAGARASLAVQTGRAEVLAARSQVAHRLRKDQLLPACPRPLLGACHRESRWAEAGLKQGVAPLGPPCQERDARVGPKAQCHHDHLPKHWGGWKGGGW